MSQEITQDKPFAVSLDVGSSLLNKTGSWRTERPEYVDRLPPCNHTCPAGENIQAWLGYAEEGDYEMAWRQIMDDNPLPATMGRVCYHPCEGACNRGAVDESVGINSVERFLGDQALRYDWKMSAGESTGKRIMIIGAGPAGLACAYHLCRLGHDVTIFESSAKAGGMIRYGIPKYRMPREKLNAEIDRIQEMGVKIELNAQVDDIQAIKELNGFDAVFIAIGAQAAKQIEIDNDGKLPMLDALEVLRKTEEEEPAGLRGRVLVYGGGNTAIDVARTAIRMEALSATVLVLESRNKMPAHEFEVKEALEEGVEIINLRSIRSIEGKQLTLEKMVDSEGPWPQPSGQFETLEVDVLVQAVGQNTDPHLLEALSDIVVKDDVTQVNECMMTGADGIFAGGDMVPSARTVTTAIGHGKKAARNIDNWLRGNVCEPKPAPEIANIDLMNTWYYSDAPRTMRPMLDVVRRQSGFAEVVGNLDESNALFEARRCMSCGNCFECDNCYGVCPDNAVTKLGYGKRFEFKYDYCKGCALCATECPCGAIKMIPEER